MQKELPTKAIEGLHDLVHQLVVGNYTGLEADGRAGRLTAAMLEQGVMEYGRTLIDMPYEAIRNVDVYPLQGETNAWNVDIVLPTVEGEDELTLQVLVESRPEGVHVEITDLHVL
jgi:hypothetical protein